MMSINKNINMYLNLTPARYSIVINIRSNIAPLPKSGCLIIKPAGINTNKSGKISARNIPILFTCKETTSADFVLKYLAKNITVTNFAISDG